MNVYLEAYGVEPYSEKFLDLAIRESLSNERISLISLQKFHFKHSNVRFLLLSLFHPRTMNNKINCIHERALRLVYSGHIYSSDELLKKDRSFSIHNRNIQSLVIEIYKFFHGLSRRTIKNFFHLNTNIPYNLRLRSELYCRNPETVK